MKKLISLFFFLAVANPLWAQDDDVAYDSAVYGSDSTGYAFDYDTTDYSYISPTIDPAKTETAVTYMNEDVQPRNFDRSKWKEIVGDEKFEENPLDLTPPEPKNLDGWKFPFSVGGEFLRTLSFIIVGIIFAFILYYVAKNTSFKQKIKSVKPLDITAPVENIEEIDTDSLLRQALADGDLRLAVRVHYLLLLKKLNEVGLIIWKKDKTNRDYLTELYGRETVYDDVRKLTVAYELVWYGERSVSQESFQRIRVDFETANRNVSNVKAPE